MKCLWRYLRCCLSASNPQKCFEYQKLWSPRVFTAVLSFVSYVPLPTFCGAFRIQKREAGRQKREKVFYLSDIFLLSIYSASASPRNRILWSLKPLWGSAVLLQLNTIQACAQFKWSLFCSPEIKTESIRKLRNCNFQWTRTFYQNNFKHTAPNFTYAFSIPVNFEIYCLGLP